MASSLADRKRRNSIMLGVSLTAIALWVGLMIYLRINKPEKSILVFLPFILIAGLNAFNAYKRLKQLREEEAGK